MGQKSRTELDLLPQLSQELQVLKFPILRQSTLKQEEVAARLDQLTTPLLLHSNFLGFPFIFFKKHFFLIWTTSYNWLKIIRELSVTAFLVIFISNQKSEK